MADAHSAESRGFWEFYRAYARSGVHAASTAALTALGLMTFVNRWFAALAIAAYVAPPLYLYVGNDGRVAAVDDADDRGTEPGDPGSGPDDRATVGTRLRDETGGPWSPVASPTGNPLFGAAAVGSEAYAVGKGGAVLRRDADGWGAVIEDGPAGESKALRGVDTTAEGGAVWFAGDGGALGRYDPETGLHSDRSAPDGHTSSWTDVTVAGPAGEESILLADGGGGVLRGERRGDELEWGTRRKPGSGSSVSAAEALDGGIGYLCDSNATVFEISDDGPDRTFDVGDGALTGVAVDGDRGSADGTANPSVLVSAADGTIHRYDGDSWARTRPTERALHGIDAEGGAAVACGEGRIVCERSDDGWVSREAPAEATLRGVAVGGDTPPIAVGDGGTVLERGGD
jgi:hypothetical protein